MFGITKYLEGLSHLFYPKLCAVCKTALIHQEEVLCLSCEFDMPFTHFHKHPYNEAVSRLSGRFPFVQAASLAYFHEEGMLQQLIHQLKYQQQLNIGRYLGKQLGKALLDATWKVDAVVVIPLHKKKEALRRFNQSAVIGKEVGQQLGVPLIDKAIIRTKNTESQTLKNRQERLDNVKGAFLVNSNIDLSQKHLLLLDDVLTTGATLESCAIELLKVEGVRLSIATVGIAM
jgi:ComF family protein